MEKGDKVQQTSSFNFRHINSAIHILQKLKASASVGLK